MATPRQRRRTKNPHKKVTRRQKKPTERRVPTMAAPEAIRAEWDAKKTLLQNYAAMGLVASVGGKKGGITKRHVNVSVGNGSGGKGKGGKGGKGERGGKGKWKEEDLANKGDNKNEAVQLSEEDQITAWLSKPETTTATNNTIVEEHSDSDSSEEEEEMVDASADPASSSDSDHEHHLPPDFLLRSGATLGTSIGTRIDKSPSLTTDKAKSKTVIKQLEELAKNARRHRRHMSANEFKGVEELIGRHGRDYVAMARDLKLNREQQTPAQLKKKVETYESHRRELERLESLTKELHGEADEV